MSFALVPVATARCEPMGLDVADDLGVAEHLVHLGGGKRGRESPEGLEIHRRRRAEACRDRGDPAVAFDRDQEARALAVGWRLDGDRERCIEVGGRAPQYDRPVPNVAADLDEFGRGVADFLQPLRGARRAPRTIDDEVGHQRAGSVGVADADATDLARSVGEPVDGDLGLDQHVRQIADSAAQVTLDERAAPADDLAIEVAPGAVPTGLVPPALVEVDHLRTVGDHFTQDAGEERFDCLRATTEQRVGMAALRHALARLGDVRDRIAIDDRDPVEMSGQRACGGQTAHARTDNDRVVLTIAGHDFLLDAAKGGWARVCRRSVAKAAAAAIGQSPSFAAYAARPPYHRPVAARGRR